MRIKSLMQIIKIIFVHLIVAHFIQKKNKGIFLLPVNFIEFYQHRHLLFYYNAIKKERGRIICLQNTPLMPLRNRRQLIKIADAQQLNTSKRNIVFSAN